jgi:hypothetical protein
MMGTFYPRIDLNAFHFDGKITHKIDCVQYPYPVILYPRNLHHLNLTHLRSKDDHLLLTIL